jgi:hypothetical protein
VTAPHVLLRSGIEDPVRARLYRKQFSCARYSYRGPITGYSETVRIGHGGPEVRFEEACGLASATPSRVRETPLSRPDRRTRPLGIRKTFRDEAGFIPELLSKTTGVDGLEDANVIE